MAGMLLAAGSVMPAKAQALLIGGGGACIGSMTLSFTPPLNATPAAPSFGVSGSANCAGVGGATLTWESPGISSIDASCSGIAAIGNGSMSFGTLNNVTVTMVTVGVSPVQVWIGINLGGTLEAAGVFAWINPGEITACATVGTTTMTLVGAFVVVA